MMERTTDKDGRFEEDFGLFPAVQEWFDALKSSHSPEEARRNTLAALVSAIHGEFLRRGRADLLFVCTHNSRRSQLAQVVASAAATYHGLGERVRSWSGGTEVTAFHPNARAALRRTGFNVPGKDVGNDTCHVTYAHDVKGPDCFSKRYDDPFNPGKDIIAVMVCTDADEACPYVGGAVARISLPYTDPKLWDGKPAQDDAYDDCLRLIASEMLLVMGELAESLS